VYLYFAVTFLLGGILGGGGVYYFGWSTGRWHRGFSKERAVRRLKKVLNLSDTQIQQVGQIFDDSAEKMRDMQKQAEPQFQVIRDETRRRIRQILTTDQAAKFDELVKQIDERHRRHGPPPLPPPPPR